MATARAKATKADTTTVVDEGAATGNLVDGGQDPATTPNADESGEGGGGAGTPSDDAGAASENGDSAGEIAAARAAAIAALTGGAGASSGGESAPAPQPTVTLTGDELELGGDVRALVIVDSFGYMDGTVLRSAVKGTVVLVDDAAAKRGVSLKALRRI